MSNWHNLSFSNASNFLESLTKVNAVIAVAKTWSCSWVDKSFRNVSQDLSINKKPALVPPSKCIVHWDENKQNHFDGCEET